MYWFFLIHLLGWWTCKLNFTFYGFYLGDSMEKNKFSRFFAHNYFWFILFPSWLWEESVMALKDEQNFNYKKKYKKKLNVLTESIFLKILLVNRTQNNCLTIEYLLTKAFYALLTNVPLQIFLLIPNVVKEGLSMLVNWAV